MASEDPEADGTSKMEGEGEDEDEYEDSDEDEDEDESSSESSSESSDANGEGPRKDPSQHDSSENKESSPDNDGLGRANSQNKEDSLLPDDSDDESYRPTELVTRRSNRLLRIAAEDPPRTPKSPTPSKSEVSGSDLAMQLLQAEKERAEAQTALARNEAMREHEAKMALQAELEVVKAKLAATEEQFAQCLDASLTAAKAFGQEKEQIAGKSPGASSASAAVTFKLLNKPAVFDGKDSSKIKVVDWLLSMRQWLSAVQADPAALVITAESYLREEAMRYWINRKKSLNEQQQQDWTVFKDALLERFDAENTPESARIRLDKLRQGGMSMAKFVSQFDQVSSYIDDISDKDLIHRFLEAVNREHKTVLRNNPAEGAPWKVYAQLRKYALHMFPDEGYSRPLTIDKSKFDSNKRKLGAGAGKLVGLADDINGGRGKRQKGQPSSSVGGGSEWKEFTNAAGRTVRRTAAQRNRCFELRLCGFCYRTGHSSANCKATKPAEGDPPGPSTK